MSQSEDQGLEVRRLRRMLKQMHHLAAHASLTGSLSGGAVDAVGQYNAILERLRAIGVIDETLFRPLPEDASFDRLGVASTLLEGYLAEETSSGGNREGEGARVVIGNVGGLDELKDLGRVIRENLPEFLRRQAPGEDGPHFRPAAPPHPPHPGPPPPPPHPGGPRYDD